MQNNNMVELLSWSREIIDNNEGFYVNVLGEPRLYPENMHNFRTECVFACINEYLANFCFAQLP